MAKIEIISAVRVNGRAYLAGSEKDAAELYEVLDKAQIKRLMDSGAIGPARVVMELEEEPEELDGPLPDGFPYKMLLGMHGFKTVSSVRSASDEDILDIDGIGQAKLDEIRSALS